MKGYSLYFAWLVSLIGVLGSLYYGEVLHMEPCRLCWYQRIALFPLALFLGIATFKDEVRIAHYCLPLAFLGALVALYQCLTQIFPSLHIEALCGAAGSCSHSGYIPYLSLLSFLLIIFFSTRKRY